MIDRLVEHRKEQVEEFLKKYGEYEKIETGGLITYQNNEYEITICLTAKDGNKIMGGVKNGKMVVITELDKYPISYLFNQIDKDIEETIKLA